MSEELQEQTACLNKKNKLLKFKRFGGILNQACGKYLKEDPFAMKFLQARAENNEVRGS